MPVLAAVVLGFTWSSWATIRAGSDSAEKPAVPQLSVQSMVVLKDLRTPLRDGDRALPNRGECLFRIARLGADMADIVTEDGTVRGWVSIDQILPLETAAEHFSRRIAAAPGDSEAYQTRGRILIEKEEWDRALADLEEASRLAPEDPRNHHLRGLVLVRKKELVQGIAAFTEAIRLDPAFALAFRDRGLAWDARRFFDQAIADLNEAVRLDPGNVAILLSRGKVCSSRGRHNQAIADFESIIRMQPGDPTGYVARGEEWMADLQSEPAIADFTKALELDPDWPRPSCFVPWPGNAGSTTPGPSPISPRPPAVPPPIRNLTGPLPGCWPPAPSASSRDGPRAVQEGHRRLRADALEESPSASTPWAPLCRGRRLTPPPSSGKPAPWSCCPATTRTRPSTAAASSCTRRRSRIGISPRPTCHEKRSYRD